MTTPYIAAKPDLYNASIDQLHARFLSILPRSKTHAQIRFRHLRCPGRREDAIAEVIAVAWKWFLRLNEQNKDVNEFVSTLADYAVRHVRSGRRLCRQKMSKDVLSPLAQQKHSFKVETLASSTQCSHEVLYGDPHGQKHADAIEERLKDNTVTPPPEQAAFRIDYPEWLSQLGTRNRAIAEDMAIGETTQDLANKYPISQGRISQLRRELHEDWLRFHGEADG
jgi:hypothetical protein